MEGSGLVTFSPKRQGKVAVRYDVFGLQPQGLAVFGDRRIPVSPVRQGPPQVVVSFGEVGP